jgi:hypothetical protein
VREPAPLSIPPLSTPALDLAIYDQLLPTQRAQPVQPGESNARVGYAHG